MRRFCPNLSELQAFEATARQGSFTRAAQELCITQGAVSKQIKNLEGFLGVSLFVRSPRGLVLTHVGQRYLHEVREGLNRIEAVSLSVMTQPELSGVLRLTSLPSFGSKWLIPRLPKLRHACPELHIEFLPHRMGYDFSSPDVDASIRYGAGVWPDSQADYVAGKELLPVCSAELFATAPRDPTDLLKHDLLHHTTVQRSWTDWFASAGMDTVRAWTGPRFDQYMLLIQAAMAGFGTALIPACLIEDELASGKLIVALDIPLQAQYAYFFCYPEHKSLLPTVQLFRRWILETARS